MTTAHFLLAITVAGLLVVATACSGDGLSAASSSTSFSSTSSSSAPPSSSSSAAPSSSSAPTTAGPGPGCSSGDHNVPAGAATGEVPDVDGDGVPDTAWINVADDGTTTVGVRTSAGGGATRPFESASPVKRSILVVDADQRPPVEIFADDGRMVELWAFQDCSIQPVLNPQGDTYTFSLGFTDVGTGVGCVELSGHMELVGLDVVAEHGDQVDWSRTVIELDGLHAHNGQKTTGTFTRPTDAAAIQLLHEVTCGELTMADDGITAGPPA